MEGGRFGLQIHGEVAVNRCPAHPDSVRDAPQKRRSQWSQNTQRIRRQTREE